MQKSKTRQCAFGLTLICSCIMFQVSSASIDGSGVPKSIDGSGTPKSIDGSGVPLSIDGSGVPKSIDGSGRPKSIDGSGVPLSIDGSGVPLSIDGSGVPKSIDGSGVPLSIDGSGIPKSIDGSGVPLSIDGSGTPKSIDGSGQPTLAIGPVYQHSPTSFSVFGYRFTISDAQRKDSYLTNGDYIALSFLDWNKKSGGANAIVRRIREQYIQGASLVYVYGEVDSHSQRTGTFSMNLTSINYLSLMSDPATNTLSRGDSVGVFGVYPQRKLRILATRVLVF